MKRLLLLLLLLAPALADDYEFLGDYRSHRMVDNRLEITTSNRPLTLTFHQGEVIRVQLGPDAEPSETVLQPLPPATFKVEDRPEALSIDCGYALVVVKKNPVRLSFLRSDGSLVLLDDESFGHGWDGKEIRTWKKLWPKEQFFGLGEKTGPINKAGRFWTMWNSDIPGYTNETDPIYGTIPFFLGRHHRMTYGIFFDNPYRSTFNLGAGNDRLFSFGAAGGSLDYYVFLGADAKRILDSYTRLTGRMAMPPKWALGNQQCRWSYYPDYEIRDVARNYRQRKIPADVLYLDIHFMDAYKVFTWDAERFPAPEALLQELKSQGFKVVTIIDPGVKVEPGYAVHDTGLAGDHFLKYLDGKPFRGQVWPGWCYFPDFRKPATRAWWGRLDADHRARGVAGFWNDMNEPALWGREMPFVVEGIKRLHNLYGYLMARATYEGLVAADPKLRPFIVSRASYAGMQKYAAIWTGDNSATFDDLALSIRMAIGLGVSGVPFVGPDIGGFIGRPTPELYIRWIQVGSMMPFMRTHSTRDTPDQEPWSLGEQVEDISRAVIERRYALMPYLYSQLHHAHRTGTPILRPLWLEFPDDELAYQVEDEFLVGPALLVAPVVADAQRFRKVHLPPGGWWDLDANQLVAGDILTEVPLERLPLYQRAGSIVCRRPPTQWVDQTPLTSLQLSVVRGRGEADLILDDSLTIDAPTEEIHFVQGQALTITSQPGPRVSQIRELTLTWHDLDRSTLRLNGQSVPSTYNPATRTLEARLPFTPGKLSLEFE
ncbi:MAG: TIM-barrel domain-containing protein [Vulcanimicrobiota bacterium]